MRQGKKCGPLGPLVIGCSNIMKAGVKEFLNVLTRSDLYIVTCPKHRQYDLLVFGKAFCAVLTVQSNKKGTLKQKRCYTFQRK